MDAWLQRLLRTSPRPGKLPWSRPQRRPEPLEDRPPAPAVITVAATNDDLKAPGLEDSFVTFREAISSINNGADFNADVTANRTGAYGVNGVTPVGGLHGIARSFVSSDP